MKPKACFFCGEEIAEKISREHIFADSFLKYLDLKDEDVKSSLPHPTGYSKVKVPSHPQCNNQTGSVFEEYILGLIKTTDSNLDHLNALQGPTSDPVHDGLRQACLT